MMNYKKILGTAQGILEDRQKSYGSAVDLHQAIATRWALVLSGKLKDGAEVSAVDVARLMAELKAARMDRGDTGEDSLLDQMNYLVIAMALRRDAKGEFDWDDAFGDD